MTISNEKISLILDILRKTALDYPRAFNNCHANNNTHPERLDFIILSTRRMWGHSGLIGSNNERVGMNGKRGISSDPSSDAIAFGMIPTPHSAAWSRSRDRSTPRLRLP
jgi:hypothetical protein